MLSEIRIRGLGVIDDATATFGPGLTVVTGETGAGKTMVLTGLHLLLGGRADSGVVRQGEAHAGVDGWVTVHPEGPVAQRAYETGAELDDVTDGDATLLLSRSVNVSGRSRAYVGGRAAPVGVLNELAGWLVAVHGQHDQQRLFDSDQQREALDRFAGSEVTTPLAEYSEKYRRLRAVEEQLARMSSLARERAREADLLRLGLAEINEVDPTPLEDDELRDEERRLSHADGLRAAATTAHSYLSHDEPDGPTDVVTSLGNARAAVDAERDHDSGLAQLADRLAEITYLANDVAADLASYADSVDVDPQRLEHVNERRAALEKLTRKYGENIAEVMEWAKAAQARLAELESDDDTVSQLQQEQHDLRAELERLAAVMTHARRAAAEKFSDEVSAELAGLALPNARVVVDVTPRDSLGPQGADTVAILFSAHNGAAPRPLNKGASGGELSRLMLAIEVVFAATSPVPTLVFDEVDAGIGGKAAVDVGQRLARLARHTQVIVVTHLPQVAAFADHHLKVEKADDGRVTTSGVHTLSKDARVAELSRMLAGLEDSTLARAHAEELLEQASNSTRAR